MKHLLLVAGLALAGNLFAQQPAVVPQPVDLRIGKGSFAISPATRLLARDAEETAIAGLLNDYLQQYHGFRLPVGREGTGPAIRFVTRKFIRAPDKDAYLLSVNRNGVLVEGDTYAGTFYGLQTLLQLLPLPNTAAPAASEIKIKQKPGKYKAKVSGAKVRTLSVPFVAVSDYPRFAYRGMHLDVSRHFFPVSFIKKYIDILAAHKLNTFHWHLTDDQGWRVEIRKYPKLTEVGGWRHGTITGRYPGTGSDNERYGGFYTQGEVREVLEYARRRYVSVLPEIEMPGHASAAIAAYPFLSCFPDEPTNIPSWPSRGSKEAQATGTPKQVQETWGVFYDIMCAGKDSTFFFLQDVLDEVMELFPGSYVHIGGDEAPKSQWKRCPRCQARMKAEGLKDEHELQSYFIRRIDQYVSSKGRKIIGWDEILEGGLSPNAVVMSWQGQRGGTEAARQGHDVVMSPQKPVYFDHAQVKPEDSLVWGGFNPLDSVYTFEPVPFGLDSSAARHILGGQANLWAEYLGNSSKVEYMLLPRLAALSEALWTPTAARNWPSFEARLPSLFKRYDARGWNSSRAYFFLQQQLQFDSAHPGVLLLGLSSRLPGAKIEVFQAGKQQSHAYRQPIRISATDRYDLILGSADNKMVQKVSLAFRFNKATGRPTTLKTEPNRSYPALGALSLVNGISSNKGLASPDWLGFLGTDMEASIDLGKSDTLRLLTLHTLDQNGSWIYLPEYVEVFVSDDGTNFRSAGKSDEFHLDDAAFTQGNIRVPLHNVTARYVRVFAKNHGVIAEGQPGAGTRAWLFADEIVVE
ncbi:MAG: beta-N-acetylhexosaminidase [Chitinophagaceae bacterium]|nr:MAG: beta-N-acetylhexosaminidase [Chitinophagaceae bacterium]